MFKVENIRERVGVLVAALAVICFIISGPAAMIATILQDKPMGFPDDWKSAMLSLASAAFGYLVGKQSTGSSSASSAVSVPVADPGSTSTTVTTSTDKPADK